MKVVRLEFFFEIMIFDVENCVNCHVRTRKIDFIFSKMTNLCNFQLRKMIFDVMLEIMKTFMVHLF